MDPGQLAKDLIQKYFPKFGSIRKDCVYRQMDPTSYDGNVNETIKAEYPLLMIWSDFSFTITQAAITKYDDSTILTIDKLIIFPALDLPVVPSILDRIVDDSLSVWSIVGIAEDPANAHFELHVRPMDQ